MKHRIKVQYVVEVESESQAEALRTASHFLPYSDTTNITIECWTPKQKVESNPSAPVPIVTTFNETLPEPAYPREG